MRAYITEQDIKKMVSECVRLLTEDIVSKNMNRARRYLEGKGVSTHEERQKIITDVREAVPNARLLNCKFLLGVTRMYYEGELNGRNGQALNQTLPLLAGAHADEYDFNLNGEKAKTIIDRFKGAVADDLETEKEKSNAKTRIKNEGYTIIPINTPEEAAKYGKYTSWCVTHDSSMYKHYTSNGIGRFYFCLRKGFEQEQPVRGDGCPLDSYGLSMIAVSINMDGSVNTITCRWNHDNGGNDNVMTVEQLEDVLGVNFYQTFKPYSREELHAKGVIFFDEVQDLLDSGKKPKNIFNWVGGFHDGFGAVELNRKFNFINTEGKLLSDTWFDWAGDFHGGFVQVELNGKYNFIDTEGKYISDTWFDYACDFRDGLARVELNEKYNFINGEGKLLSDVWFDRTYDFVNGFGTVELNRKFNFINTEGLISDTWFDEIWNFYDGFAKIGMHKKYNLINTKGEYLSDTWFDWAGDFYDGLAMVELNGKFNFINTEGKLLSDVWFDRACNFLYGGAKVELNGKFNFINTEGKLLSDTWFDEAWSFRDGLATVWLDGKYYNLDKEGKLHER